MYGFDTGTGQGRSDSERFPSQRHEIRRFSPINGNIVPVYELVPVPTLVPMLKRTLIAILVHILTLGNGCLTSQARDFFYEVHRNFRLLPGPMSLVCGKGPRLPRFMSWQAFQTAIALVPMPSLSASASVRPAWTPQRILQQPANIECAHRRLGLMPTQADGFKRPKHRACS